MAEDTSPQKDGAAPEPESLTEQPDDGSRAPDVGVADIAAKKRAEAPVNKKASYRPSHRATFIGIIVVLIVLAVNAAVIWFIIQANNQAAEVDRESVTLSSETLSTLGVTRSDVGDQAAELTIGPNTTFNGTITVAEQASFASELVLNNQLTGQTATFTGLTAGDTAVDELNVNGDASITTLNLRQDLNVAGATRLQGAVTIGQVLTVNGSLTVGANVAVNGTLSVNNLQVNDLQLNSSLIVGGRIISTGSAPNVGPGGGVGSNGTVSISGNDTAGTVAVNIGVGGGNGMLAQVAFNQAYPSTPRVVVSTIGGPVPNMYITRSAGGFTIYNTGALSTGGYAFDYIVMQ